MADPAIVWFRRDLRTTDNPALHAAAACGRPLIPVFLWSPDEEGDSQPGAASRWWLHQSLISLNTELEHLGSRLIVRRQGSFAALEELIEETGATAVYWNRCYEAAAIQRDRDIKAVLKNRGLEVHSFNASLLYEPWAIETKQHNPYQVFTPFWKACAALETPAEPLNQPTTLKSPPNWPKSTPLKSLQLEPEFDWAMGMSKLWQPGTAGAQRQLRRFLDQAIEHYSTNRDVPALTGTSQLSPYLHFGEIGPRQIWHAVKGECDFPAGTKAADSVKTFVSELGWREFAHHVLYHFPETRKYPLKPRFDHFPWRDDDRALQAWKQGQTGYPIVDAGMRELWETGWMHNRVRMLVGSFLTKDLMLDWREGAAWFWDTLVDADLANNTLGWQWVSGCGADAAPYFRVFNPVSQGEKFDPTGDYVRRWIPELKDLPDRWIHQPWNASSDVLQSAGIELGTTYPRPIVDHGEARKLALEAFASIKNR